MIRKAWLITALALSCVGFAACARPANQVATQRAIAIFGGRDVSPEEYLAKTVVAIHLKRAGTNEGPMCTGIILSQSLILTAAHCMVEPNVERTILFGVDGVQPVATRSIVRHTEHPEWLTTAAAYMTHPEERTVDDNVQLLNRSWNDISILKFEGGLPAGFEPAHLLDNPEKLTKDTLLVAAGYGLSEPERNIGVGRLRTTELNLDNPNSLPGEFSIEQRERGTCEGDSGGPVFIKDGERLLVAGITSHGINDIFCKGKTIFTNVPFHHEWIKRVSEVLSPKLD